jgi:hypothetical protein
MGIEPSHICSSTERSRSVSSLTLRTDFQSCSNYASWSEIIIFLSEIPQLANYTLNYNSKLSVFQAKNISFGDRFYVNKNTIQQHMQCHDLTQDCLLVLTQSQYDKYKRLTNNSGKL